MFIMCNVSGLLISPINGWIYLPFTMHKEFVNLDYKLFMRTHNRCQYPHNEHLRCNILTCSWPIKYNWNLFTWSRFNHWYVSHDQLWSYLKATCHRLTPFYLIPLNHIGTILRKVTFGHWPIARSITTIYLHQRSVLIITQLKMLSHLATFLCKVAQSHWSSP